MLDYIARSNHSSVTLALCSRLLVWLIALVAHNVSGSYDTSVDTLLLVNSTADAQCSHAALTRLIRTLLLPLYRWDAVYFLHISQHGYTTEQIYAFFPLLPMLVRYTVKLIQLVTFSSSYLPCPNELHLLIGSSITLLAFVVSASMMHQLSKRMFGSSQSMQQISTLLYCFNPASIFFSAPYTESLYTLLSASGMLLYHDQRLIAAAIVWSLATASRSNGILLSIFVAHSACQHLLSVVRKGGTSIELIGQLIRGCLLHAACICIVVAPYIVYQLHIQQTMCTQQSSTKLPSYCDSRLPLGVYSYVQHRYWNVGLFNYYTVQQLPNFLLAAPMLVTALYAVWSYAKFNGPQLAELAPAKAVATNASQPAFNLSTQLTPYINLLVIQLMVCFTILHVQVSTRFLSTNPAVYWCLAQLSSESLQSGQPHASRWRLTNSIVAWLLLYFVLGSVMFATFLPFT